MISVTNKISPRLPCPLYNYQVMQQLTMNSRMAGHGIEIPGELYVKAIAIILERTDYQTVPLCAPFRRKSCGGIRKVRG